MAVAMNDVLSRKGEKRRCAVQAVIFLGASSVSMLVAEEDEGGLRVLDVLTQPAG